jgi:hypothetical protein
MSRGPIESHHMSGRDIQRPMALMDQRRRCSDAFSAAWLSEHILMYFSDLLFNTQASCSKCPPCAWLHFLTRVTRELVSLWSTAALLMLLAALRIRWNSSSLVFTFCAYTRTTPVNSQHCKKHQQCCSASKGYKFSGQKMYPSRWMALQKTCQSVNGESVTVHWKTYLNKCTMLLLPF